MSTPATGEPDAAALPGFRFHPTDQELVGFYLQRKVGKKPITTHLIQQIDLYKYNPWDLPKGGPAGDTNEWYFFCKRGRKYKNSVRPNRVTGSGFWKATGIDKPVYAAVSGGDAGAEPGSGEGRACIGLKKSLVYYRGNAGKGTKTDWMMHEFRLPTVEDREPPFFHHVSKNPKLNPLHLQPEAEVWTVCRVFRRNAACKRQSGGAWEDADASAGKRRSPAVVACGGESDDQDDGRQGGLYMGCLSFEAPPAAPASFEPEDEDNGGGGGGLRVVEDDWGVGGAGFDVSQCCNGAGVYEGWDELRSVVDQSFLRAHIWH